MGLSNEFRTQMDNALTQLANRLRVQKELPSIKRWYRYVVTGSQWEHHCEVCGQMINDTKTWTPVKIPGTLCVDDHGLIHLQEYGLMAFL
jgi:hypothetical protein